MKQLLAAVALVLAGALVVEVMADATQTRGDRTPPESQSRVVFELTERSYNRHIDTGARGLVWACIGVTASEIVSEPDLAKLEDGIYEFAVQPALGVENRRKLRGCMEDFTVDRLRGDVLTIDRIDDAEEEEA